MIGDGSWVIGNRPLKGAMSGLPTVHVTHDNQLCIGRQSQVPDPVFLWVKVIEMGHKL